MICLANINGHIVMKLTSVLYKSIWPISYICKLPLKLMNINIVNRGLAQIYRLPSDKRFELVYTTGIMA